MYGAIFGDIIGSRFEFDRGGKTKEFKLFTEQDSFTDDTAMTIAVGDGLMKAGVDASVEEIKKAVIESMQDWGHRYPNAGYGGRFIGWLFNGRNPKPYGSYGNGSAMRVSAAGWLYDSLERTREVARATAQVTHNHPEGIKGADCTATVMYMGRTGSSKEEILDYVTKEFGYDISETLDQMRMRHEHIESCQDSLPKALRAFFDGESYEDVVRNAVSLGGDTDTLAAIAGAMAEAFYGLPIMILAEGRNYLPQDMLDILYQFDLTLGRISDAEETEDKFEDNKYIKYAISQIAKAGTEEENRNAHAALIGVLAKRMTDDGEALAPMVDKNNVLDSFDIDSVMMGDSISFDRELRMTIDKVQDGEGNAWIPLYTDDEEIDKGQTTNLRINLSILTILEEAILDGGSNGLVINPFGQSITLPKEIVKIALDYYQCLLDKQE